MTLRWRTGAWLRERIRLPLACAALGAWGGLARTPAARDLPALASALGRSAGDAVVSGNDVRWEPSGGAALDYTLGRRVLFLASPAGDDARDVWRARVRVSPEGAALEVAGAHDLTNTPLGDDHELVVRGTRAAFATRAYGQEQSLTALDLAGEGIQNRTEGFGHRTMAAITNLQQTGSVSGIGRVDVTLDSPAAAAALDVDESALAIALYDDRRAMATRSARLDLATGELVSGAPGIRAAASMHLPKRFSHWTVDTLRAVSWIGPAPIASLEDAALAMRDAYRRFTFKASGGAAASTMARDAPPPVLDTSQASVEEAHWPPPRIQSIWKVAEKGEGDWAPPDVPWLRRVPGVAADAPLPVYVSFVRPDDERPYAKVLLVAMDTRQLDLDMEAGVEDPEPLTGLHGAGRIPRDPAIYRRVLAAFNGAFKTEHGHYGMMVHKRVLLPALPGSATVAVLDDGRIGFGTWVTGRKGGTAEGEWMGDNAIASFRQNLDPLIDHGQINPTGRNLWGFTLPGKGAQTERSGICVTTSGHLLYAWGDDVSGTTLAKAMKMGGCDYAIHLDMNPYHTGFLFAAIDDLAGKKYRSQLLTSAMSIPVDRYIQYAPKDFFYVMVHDPAPPAADGATAWEADGGTQPPPHWFPGLFRARAGDVELSDIEPGRATWRIRAGVLESPASNPLRELTGDDAMRVLVALGAGIAQEKKPRGIATDGRLAVPLHGAAESGALVIGSDGTLAMVRATDAAPVGSHDDMLELPIVVWDGKVEAAPSGAVAVHAAIGLTPSGRVLIARGSSASVRPLAEALARAGCTRALSLDRGAHASAFLDRAGTANPPRGRYDESVVYAIAAPLHPRGFTF